MGIIVAKSNDPLYRLDQIYDDIYSRKYPNDTSVMDDSLRGSLQELYGINLNLYDTHKIQFATPQSGIANIGMSVLEPETFYVYEGDGDKVLFPNIDENDIPDIHGVYPEGTLIGLLDCKLRNQEYREKNGKLLFTQMLYLASNYINFDNIKNGIIKFTMYARAYAEYLDFIPMFFALKKCIDNNIPMEDICGVTDNWNQDIIRLVYEDKDRFLKLMNSYDYTKIYKLIKDIIDYKKNMAKYTPVDEVNRSDSIYPEGRNTNFDCDDYSGMKVENPNNEFKEKYESYKDQERKELDEELMKSAKELVDPPKFPEKEFHVYMYNCFEDEDIEDLGLCVDAKSTKTQIDIGAQFIYTTNTHYVTTDLIRKGYRIFIHMTKDKINEIKIGHNDWTDREIKWGHKLENFLYNGEM